MKIKLTILAAVIIASVASSAAIAGRTKSETPKKPAGMSCCAAPEAATPAPVSEKEAPAHKGMSCHSAAPAAKGCCK